MGPSPGVNPYYTSKQRNGLRQLRSLYHTLYHTLPLTLARALCSLVQAAVLDALVVVDGLRRVAEDDVAQRAVDRVVAALEHGRGRPVGLGRQLRVRHGRGAREAR